MSNYNQELSYQALNSRVSQVYKYGINSSTREHINRWKHKNVKMQSSSCDDLSAKWNTLFGIDLYDKFRLSLQDILLEDTQINIYNSTGSVFFSRTIYPANAISTNPNSLRGDALKRAILILATAMLVDSSIDIKEFDLRVESFKKSKAYKILEKPQGEFYSFFKIPTTSLTAFHKIVHDLRKEKYTPTKSLALTNWSM